MKRYLRLYRVFLQINFSKLVAYRGNFINGAFTSLLWAVLSLISISLLTSRNPNVFGWTRDELLILTGVYSIVIGMFHVLFTKNLEQISRIAHRGQLDPILSKPTDMQFYLSCSIINYSAIPRVLAAIVFVAYLLWHLRIEVSIIEFIQFLLLSIAGITFLYAIWFSILTVTIWQSQLHNLSDLLFHVTDSAKYPSEMYNEFRYYITVFLLPLSLIITLPTKALFHRVNLVEMVALILLAVVSLMISRISGKFALRYYTSVSS